jgi:hypothetical protein
LGYFTFNDSTCNWDNDGTTQPTTKKVNCWDTLPTILLVDNDGTNGTTCSTRKVNCWDTFTFNTSTCTWDNDGLKPNEPTKVNCWDTLLSTSIQPGIMMVQLNLLSQQK